MIHRLPGEIVDFIDTASKEDLDAMSEYVKMARKRWGKWRVKTLELGDTVTWESGRTRGKHANKTFTGTVVKINKTRVKVNTQEGTWNVPGSMLEVV